MDKKLVSLMLFSVFEALLFFALVHVFLEIRNPESVLNERLESLRDTYRERKIAENDRRNQEEIKALEMAVNGE